MGETKKLLKEVVKLGFTELVKKNKNISILMSEESDGIFCTLEGKEYLITITPCSGTILKDNPVDLVDSTIRVSNLLREIGIPPHIKGYPYIKEAITLVHSDIDYIYNITKRLYPDIAKKYGTTSSRVERSIRHAVEIAVERGNPDYINNLFGYTMSMRKRKPTNSEFICTLVNTLYPLN